MKLTPAEIVSLAPIAFPDSRPMTEAESAAVYAIVRARFKAIVEVLPTNEAADAEVDRVMAPVRSGKKRPLRRKP